MNIQHSVNAPALSGKRSMLRRFVTAATMGALLLGVASASADGKAAGSGTFTLSTIAGGGESYTGTLAVNGDGKFGVTDDGANIVFTLKAGDLNMKDGRQKHTVGDDTKLGLKGGDKVTLTIEKSKLKFPEAGGKVDATVPGTVSMMGKTSQVTVKYSAKEEGGKYRVSGASFDLKYTEHRPMPSAKDLKEIEEDATEEAKGDEKKKAEIKKRKIELARRVCLMIVCVKPTVTIKTNGEFVIDAKK